MATRLVTLVVITEPPLHRLQWRPNNLSLNSPTPRPCPATRWDSNAETVRSRRFGTDFKRRGESDDEDEEEDEEEEENDGFFRRKRKKRRWWSDEFDDGGVIEEAIDNFWVFKVFKAYGWFFPVILASWLLSSGPKAFLMALALPLGQSALSMAFDKLWGGTAKRRPRRRPRTNQSSSSPEQQEEETGQGRKGKTGYQSWAVGGDEKGAGFGGWDDLERGTKSDGQRASRARDSGGSESKGKLSRGGRRRRSDTPLFLRLLVAVFPFLGSWTNMLW